MLRIRVCHVLSVSCLDNYSSAALFYFKFYFLHIGNFTSFVLLPKLQSNGTVRQLHFINLYVKLHDVIVSIKKYILLLACILVFCIFLYTWYLTILIKLFLKKLFVLFMIKRDKYRISPNTISLQIVYTRIYLLEYLFLMIFYNGKFFILFILIPLINYMPNNLRTLRYFSCFVCIEILEKILH